VDYTRAIELDSSYADAYNNRGYTYYMQEEYELAIADYDRAIELDPKHPLAYANRVQATQKISLFDRFLRFILPDGDR